MGKITQRGGSRKGAGRPKTTQKIYSFRADANVSAFIDSQPNKTDFIRNCIQTEMEGTARRSGGRQGALPDALQDTTQETQRLHKIGTILPARAVKPLTLPYFDIKIVAGFPIPLDNDEISQNVELLQMLCPHPDSSYLIRVQGDSMIDAGVNDGDILIVDKSSRNPTEKQIAVCEYNGEYTVKRVKELSGKFYLVPANPKYPKIEIGDGDDFSVWGIVTFIIHKPLY